MTQPEFLAVENLRRSFGGVNAVDGVSFAVAAGTITGIIGPNGAGKSSVLGLIAGAIQPSGGRISYRGCDITGLPPYRIARLGIGRTFQASSEFPSLTVMENLLTAVRRMRGDALAGALLGKPYWRSQEDAHVNRARGLLSRFGMAAAESIRAGNLSGGQKRLLELMRALMMEPELLLLDEPFAGVNPSLAREIQDHLLQLRQAGLTMLMIEHELGIVERVCDPVLVMANGKVIAEGSMAELRRRQEVLDAYLVG